MSLLLRWEQNDWVRRANNEEMRKRGHRGLNFSKGFGWLEMTEFDS